MGVFFFLILHIRSRPLPNLAWPNQGVPTSLKKQQPLQTGAGHQKPPPASAPVPGLFLGQAEPAFPSACFSAPRSGHPVTISTALKTPSLLPSPDPLRLGRRERPSRKAPRRCSCRCCSGGHSSAPDKPTNKRRFPRGTKLPLHRAATRRRLDEELNPPGCPPSPATVLPAGTPWGSGAGPPVGAARPGRARRRWPGWPVAGLASGWVGQWPGWPVARLVSR